MYSNFVSVCIIQTKVFKDITYIRVDTSWYYLLVGARCASSVHTENVKRGYVLVSSNTDFSNSLDSLEHTTSDITHSSFQKYMYN